MDHRVGRVSGRRCGGARGGGERVFRTLIAERRAHPQAGLVDELIALQRDGYVVGDRRMTDLDLIGHCAMLLAAGYQTTVAIANLVLFADATTDEHADGIPVSVREQLYGDRALLPGAIEETLRFYPPYPASRRRVAAYSELGGQVVRPGRGSLAGSPRPTVTLTSSQPE
jgi:cytochrome P450